MVFRVPTHLESFIPPPASQAPNTADVVHTPWRGQFLVSGIRASDIRSNVEIRATAAETEGDTQSHLWPGRFVFSIAPPHALPVLPQLQSYLRHRSPPVPLTTFMPDKIRDSNQNAVNQSHFRSLSRLLWEEQLVAVIAISISNGIVGRHGILLFPASNSSSFLFGAMFLTPADTFPDFVYAPGATQTPPSYPSSSSYDNSLQRGSSSAHSHDYEAHMNPLSYPSHFENVRRRSSHSVSPISPPGTHPPYRYDSPAPAMMAPPQNPAAMHISSGAAFEPRPYPSSDTSGNQSESSTDPGSAYPYSAHRGASTRHPLSRYE